MKSCLFLFAVLATIAVSACTTVKGTVQIVPKTLNTDAGMFNSPDVRLGSLFVVATQNSKLVATRIKDFSIPASAPPANPMDLTAESSSGLKVSITVNPADDAIKAFAEAEYQKSVLVQLKNYYRRNISDIPQFLRDNDGDIRKAISDYPDGSIWLITSEILAESFSLVKNAKVSTNIQAAYKKIGSASISVDTTSADTFTKEAAKLIKGSDRRICLFVSLQEIKLNAVGGLIQQGVMPEQFGTVIIVNK